MAASTGHVRRVKLTFERLNTEPSWFCINTNEHKYVSDVEASIALNFNLCFKNVKLILGEFRLPSWESVLILRDDEHIQVLPDMEAVPCPEKHDSNTSKKLKKSKKKDSRKPILSESELERLITKTLHTIDEVDKNVDHDSSAHNDKTEEESVLKKRKLEILSNHNLVECHFDRAGEIVQGHNVGSPKVTAESVDKDTADCNDTEVSCKKKKRNRKRKRRRTAEEIVDNSETPCNLAIKKDLTMNLPYSKQPLGQHKTFVEDRHCTGSQEVTQKNSDDCDVRPDYKIWTKAKTYSNGDGFNSTNSSFCATREMQLSNGVTVYIRPQKNRNNKNNLLASTLNNAEAVSPLKIVHKTDYSKYASLDRPPRKGDKIAYKTIELTSSCTPEVSAYKVGTVLWYDAVTTMVELLLTITEENLPNRFSMDSEITGVEDSVNQVKMHLEYLLEAKLLN